MSILYCILCILNPIFDIPYLIYDYCHDGNNRRIAFWSAMSFSCIAYRLQSTYVGDIERYINALVLYENKTIFNSFDVLYKGLYSTDIYFWIISRFSNGRVLVSITTFILYFLSVYVLLDCTDALNAQFQQPRKRGVIIFISYLAVTPLYSYISSVRSSLGITIAMAAMYMELAKNKNRILSIILYCIAVMFHQAALVIVFARILVAFVKKISIKATIILIIVIATIGIGGIIISDNNTMLSNFIIKTNEYSGIGVAQNSRWAIAVSNSRFAKTVEFFYGLTIVYVILDIIKILKVSSWQLCTNLFCKKSLYTACYYLLCITFGMMFFPTQIYLRFATALSPYLLVLMYLLCIEHRKNYVDIIMWFWTGCGFLLNIFSCVVAVNNKNAWINIFKGILLYLS